VQDVTGDTQELLSPGHCVRPGGTASSGDGGGTPRRNASLCFVTVLKRRTRTLDVFST
jgi:hypothetical protein